MVNNNRNKTVKFLLLAALVVLLIPAKAQAYIGPGAGFAVVGSLLAVFTATLSAVLALFTWIRCTRTGRHGLCSNERIS